MLEIVKFDLKDLVSSLKLLIFDAENLLERVISRLIRALRSHSLKLNSDSSLRRACSMVVEAMKVSYDLTFKALKFSQLLSLVSFLCALLLYINYLPRLQKLPQIIVKVMV